MMWKLPEGLVLRSDPDPREEIHGSRSCAYPMKHDQQIHVSAKVTDDY